MMPNARPDIAILKDGFFKNLSKNEYLCVSIKTYIVGTKLAIPMSTTV